MKNSMIILFMLSAIFVGMDAQGQIVLPDDYPKTTLTQDLGFNRITVEYNRPSTDGHIIFGERIPYGETWLDETKTYMQFSITGKLLFEGEHELEAGNYFLTTIPNADNWTIIISKGIPGRDPSFGWADPSIYSLDKVSIFRPGEELFRFFVKTEKLCEKMESLTVQFANVCSTCVRMQIMWDYTRVAFNVSTEVDGEILEEIEAFTNNPELKLAGQYYLAAKYYLDTNRELDKALEWADKSLSYTPDAYWVMHTKAEILAAMGEYKQAIDVAESSLDIAKKKNDMDYVRINEMEIKRWKDLRKGGM